MPKISIITVVKNNERDIERCIHSVISQNCLRSYYEYIIIDGKSTDKTLSIINKYENSVDLIISEEDSGISAAFNKGLNLSNGDFVLFLSSDDYLHNNYCLKTILENLNNKNDIYLYGIKLLINYKHYYIIHPPKNLNGIKSDMIFCHPGMIVNRSLLLKYPFDKRLLLAMDYKQSLQLFLNNYKFKTSSTILTVVSNAGISHKNYISSRIECFNVQREYFSFTFSLLNLLKAIIRYYVRLLFCFLKLEFVINFYHKYFSKNFKQKWS